MLFDDAIHFASHVLLNHNIEPRFFSLMELKILTFLSGLLHACRQ